MRVFLDTNVLVSAFGTRGVCADLFRLVADDHELVISEKVLEEFQRILPQQFDATREETRTAMAILQSFEIVKTPAHAPDIMVRDPDDALILAAAIEAKADVLVTGDKDLLDVAGKSPVRIVNPRGFFELVE